MTEQRFREIIREELTRAGVIPTEPPVSAGFVKELDRVKREFARKVALRQEQARP